jgi:DNA repair ATPase RecN
MADTDYKIELEKVKTQVENVSGIQSKLDTAIDKLTDVSTSIKSMLAVHEEKLSRSEQIDEVIFGKIKDRAEETDKVYRDLSKEINQVERRLLIEIKSLKNEIGSRVGVLEKWRWIIVGSAIIIGWILSKNLMPLLHMMNGPQ